MKTWMLLIVVVCMTGCAQTQTVLTLQPDDAGKIRWKVSMVVPNDIFIKEKSIRHIEQ
jgi:uncharacterized lipoprotein YmbA